MKLVTIDAREVAGRPGVLLDTGNILDLSAVPGSLSASQWIPQSTISILAAGERGLDHALGLVAIADEGAERLRESGALSTLAGTALMAPIRRPGLILISQAERNGQAASFIKSPNTAVGHASRIRMHGQRELVAHPMFAAVLGRPLYQADFATAQAALAAWTLLVDLAPAQPEPSDIPGWRKFTEARQFPGSLPMGPALVTLDEVADPADLEALVRINGVLAWSGALGPPAEVCLQRLAALSASYAFSPGDVIAFESDVSNKAKSSHQTVHADDVFSVSAGQVMELGFELVG
jgi:2-keto-4-pentenoate hydratase/2-oxohepta-3-ene-1,7-dioic acid hydratase in catechol pathway